MRAQMLEGVMNENASDRARTHGHAFMRWCPKHSMGGLGRGYALDSEKRAEDGTEVGRLHLEIETGWGGRVR